MHVAPVLTILVSLATVLPAAALTADELVAKNVAARGGREALAAIKTLRAAGQATMGGGDDVITQAYVEVKKRPAMLRRERSMQGLTAITAFDGDTGWRLSPFGGRRDPDKLPPDIVKSLKVDADIDGPLVDYKQKGSTVEYLGTEDVDGTDAHKLKVTLKNGDVKYVYLDPDYFLEIRVLSLEMARGVQQESEMDLGNYEKVAGVYFPFSIEIGPKGGPKGFKLSMDKIEANVDVDDGVFHFPAPAAGGGK